MHRGLRRSGLQRDLDRHLVDPLGARARAARAAPAAARRAHWIDVARLGIRLARRAVEEAGRARRLRGRVRDLGGGQLARRARQRSSCSARVFEEEPPDLLLLETLTLIREPETFETVELLLETGLPVWLSFRRCRHGVCGVFGQHWGPPEGDLFGRAARRFEEMGVGALLINCLPVDHVPGMISWLRDFTELPLGVYPNLGHLAGSRWRFDDDDRPRGVRRARARLARRGRADRRRLLRRDRGAHRRARDRRSPARSRAASGRRSTSGCSRDELPPRRPSRGATSTAASSSRCRSRSSRVDEGVFVPTTGQLPRLEDALRRAMRARPELPRRRLRLRHPRRAARAQRRRARARDRHRRAAPSPTRSRTAFRNGVADRVTRRDRRPLPVGAERALRPDRGEPLPDAGRPVRGAERPPPARLLGPQPARPLHPAPAAAARGRRPRAT